MSKPIAPLAEALQQEIDRVRDDVLPTYVAIGAPGGLAMRLIRKDLAAAAKALGECDVVAMIQSYKTLKEITE